MNGPNGGALIDAKVVFLGACSVGKTSIIGKAKSHALSIDPNPTVGACYTSFPVKLSDCEVNLQIWDTAGAESFKSVAPIYYRGASVAVLVFDVSDPKSVEAVKYWIDQLKANNGNSTALLVVGNKSDLTSERKISQENGDAFAKKSDALYMETSAKTGSGIDELITLIAETSLKSAGGSYKPEPKGSVEISEEEKKGGCC